MTSQLVIQSSKLSSTIDDLEATLNRYEQDLASLKSVKQDIDGEMNTIDERIKTLNADTEKHEQQRQSITEMLSQAKSAKSKIDSGVSLLLDTMNRESTRLTVDN
jgi:chromosome segregation ATPase